VLEHLRLFVAAFDIEGLGYATLNQLIERKMVRDPSDLFRLTRDQLLTLEGFADKSVQNLLDRLQAGKTTTLVRFLVALGIPHVGWATATVLADSFESLAALQDASTDDLRRAGGIGPIVAEDVHAYFQRSESRQLIERLLAAGVTISAPERQEGPLSGKTFVLTGTLSSMPRSTAEERIKALGGVIGSGVTKKTDYLVVGADPGSKLDRGQKLKIPILDEAAFLDLIRASE
ncbi:MAG TPA: helix-hairpin-helix domain-containing protein, partial [Candidatus Acidoferrum sp.]|nr:helix-hairpin-helix domain-containing protein [Candidatus Acidoferrum sp.]